MATTPSFLFYEDEDKILPLLLHAVDSQGQPCSCRDCLALQVRMSQIELLMAAAPADAQPLSADPPTTVARSRSTVMKADAA